MISTIVVPLERRDNAEPAVSTFAKFATRLGARLSLVTVAAPGRADDLAAGRNWIEAFAARIATPGLAVNGRAVAGEVTTCLLRATEEDGADLFAMTARRQTALARRFRGSAADRLLVRARIPVLVVREDRLDPFATTGGVPDRLIVPLDGSQLSERSIPVAHWIASKVGASILFIQSTPPVAYGAAARGAQQGRAGQAPVSVGAVMRDNVHRYAGDARRVGIEAEGRAVFGPADVVIKQAADDAAGCLIVMSSHGRSGIRRVVLGSVTDKVVRTSGHPVLVVPS